LSSNLSKKCQTENIRTYIISMPPKIQSFVVRKDGFYTICINEALCPEARMKAYRHEVDHITRGDFESDTPTGLLEIRAHRNDRREI